MFLKLGKELKHRPKKDAIERISGKSVNRERYGTLKITRCKITSTKGIAGNHGIF